MSAKSYATPTTHGVWNLSPAYGVHAQVVLDWYVDESSGEQVSEARSITGVPVFVRSFGNIPADVLLKEMGYTVGNVITGVARPYAKGRWILDPPFEGMEQILVDSVINITDGKEIYLLLDGISHGPLYWSYAEDEAGVFANMGYTLETPTPVDTTPLISTTPHPTHTP